MNENLKQFWIPMIVIFILLIIVGLVVIKYFL